MLIEMFTVRAHLVFEVVNVTEPIQIWLTELRTTADKLYSSTTINRSEMNSSIIIILLCKESKMYSSKVSSFEY